MLLCFLTVCCLARLSAADANFGHHVHTHGSHGIHDEAVMMNEDHIKMHLSNDYGIKKEPREMSKSELEFYEFKTHDYDSNGQLDGLELLKAMSHYDLIDINHLTDEDKRTLTPSQMLEKRDRLIAEKYASMEKDVDHLLTEHDTNKDGYVNYAEYLMARWKNE